MAQSRDDCAILPGLLPPHFPPARSGVNECNGEAVEELDLNRSKTLREALQTTFWFSKTFSIPQIFAVLRKWSFSTATGCFTN
jgi:hypothetical protein